MKTIGLPKATKNGEKRLALVPSDIKNIDNPNQLFIEENYGKALGYEDEQYKAQGCNITNRETALSQDIVCDPKIGDATYLEELKDRTIIFGWVHAVQNPDLANLIVNKEFTAYAWEDLYEKGRHNLYKNNITAGKSAILHAILSYGETPRNKKVALIGRGNTAKGAFEILSQLGADVTIYDRRMEDLFQEEYKNYDIIVNCILWDTSRDDHLLYAENLKNMKENSLIIDVSCDPAGGIETSKPTKISDPLYEIDGVIHYAVDNTPSLLFRESTAAISEAISPLINKLIKNDINDVLKNSIIIDQGEIIDERITEYQKLHGLL